MDREAIWKENKILKEEVGASQKYIEKKVGRKRKYSEADYLADTEVKDIEPLQRPKFGSYQSGKKSEVVKEEIEEEKQVLQEDRDSWF